MYLSGFLVSIVSMGILKTGVTLLALWLLWRVHQGKRGSPKARLGALARAEHGAAGKFLFWGLVAFLVSELTCGVEIYVLFGPNVALRLVHSIASAAGAALLLYGTLLAFDRRVFHYFDESRACVLVPVCKTCPRREGLACKFHGAYFWGLCFVVVTAIPLLCIPVRELVADPATIALPWESLNAFFDREVVPWLGRVLPHWRQETMYFIIPKEMTLAEFRYIPITSIVLGISALVLSCVNRREKLSFMLACFAVGPLVYAYLQAGAYHLVGDVYLGSLGHETVEILGLAALRSVLYELLSDNQ